MTSSCSSSRNQKQNQRLTPEQLAPFACLDCGFDTCYGKEYYMVHADVWKQSGVSPNGGMLCDGCLEGRIGRELTGADFTDAPCNYIFEGSDRLRDRMSR